MTRPLPAGWREATLGELVPKEALEPLTEKIKEIKAGKVPASAVHEALVGVLAPHAEHLEQKGVLVSYLAYAIENAINTGAI